MGIRDLLFVSLIVGAGAALGASLYPPRIAPRPSDRPSLRQWDDAQAKDTLERVNQSFRDQWNESGLSPAPRAPELAVIRRLSLALTGSIPSLQEIRRLESIPEGERIHDYAERLLLDRRFGDYFAERLARVYVGTEGGPFIVYRRRRFVSWLSDQLMQNRPYDQVVGELIAKDGLWTDQPATNFVMVTWDPERKVFDPERLAGRVARAFLGARIDCAQCHDHPFAPWKQGDFQGLAAFFAQIQSGLTGLHDELAAYRPTDRKTGKAVTVEPRVPNHEDLLPPIGQGDRRERLASWVTNPANPALGRATVNRIWALMFGRPLVDPIDEVATAEDVAPALGILADDFVAHGFDIRRLIRIIVDSEVFRLDSACDPHPTPEQDAAWAVFPLSRLRPEQVVGGLIQSASLTTIDYDSSIFVRIGRTVGTNNFVQRFGDPGEDEFDEHSGTITQRLLMMNGELVREKTKPDLLGAVHRVSHVAPSNRAAVEVAYLTTLTRKPTPEEAAYFEGKLAGSTGKDREERVSDLFWILVNATEFSWNH